MKHPTPWTIRDGLIWDAQGALVTDEDERIVACVNAHDRLLAALQRFADSVEVREHNVLIIAPNIVRLAEEARALLKEIRG